MIICIPTLQFWNVFGKVVRKKLEDTKETLLKINDLKNEEDHQLEMWQNTLAEIEKKIDFIDHSLNEPESF